VANLLLSRGTGRRAELSIRAAIGAGRGRIVRQLLTECVLLALLAAGVGLLMGVLGVRVLMTYALVDLARGLETISVSLFDPWVTGFTLVLAVGTVAAFGPVPAVRLSSIDLMSSLRGAAVSGDEPVHHRTQAALVAAEIALAVMVVCSAALLMQSLSALRSVSLGFTPDNLVGLDLLLTDPDYGSSRNVGRLAMQAVALSEDMPGVQAAAFASALPLEGFMDIIFDIPGRPHLEGHSFTGNVQWRFVSANYFDVMDVPLLAGRTFHEQEGSPTALINQTLADEFWPDANPVGQTILLGQGLGVAFESRGPTEIVGVVGDLRGRLDLDPFPTIYQTPAQIPDDAMALMNGNGPAKGFIVRSRSGIDPISTGMAVKEELEAVLGVPVLDVRTMDRLIADSVTSRRSTLLIVNLFAGAAVLLASVGVYSVVSYGVRQRVREIGLRSALGARTGDILRLLLCETLRTTAIGALLGGVGSLALAPVLRAQLVGIEPWDPVTLTAVPLILLSVALVAASIPALQALRVSPTTALRDH
jgi:putative ABC transport system permease protein